MWERITFDETTRETQHMGLRLYLSLDYELLRLSHSPLRAPSVYSDLLVGVVGTEGASSLHDCTQGLVPGL